MGVAADVDSACTAVAPARSRTRFTSAVMLFAYAAVKALVQGEGILHLHQDGCR